MRRSARLAEKRVKIENEPQRESKTKKKRSNDKISAIATLDNGTMVEAFKFFNYSQLAKKNLVSMRFRNLIQTHRNSLARLFVDSVTMKMSSYSNEPVRFKIFNKMLSRGVYNKWVVSNNYSKQIPLEGQIAGNENSQDEHGNYELCAVATYKGQKSVSKTSVLFARIQLNHECWPVYQHFVRLLADPSIYIRSLELTPQFNILNLLASANTSDHNRVQCNELVINIRDNMQKSIKWIKDHAHCNEFRIYDDSRSNCDQELLDFFMTGANCTSIISVKRYDLSTVIIDFVQKFMNLKSCAENEVVESIKCYDSYELADELKRKYANLVEKEEMDEYSSRTTQSFDYVNADIGKKLLLTATNFDGKRPRRIRMTYFVLKIENL